MDDPTSLTLLILFGVALLAGGIDAIAGGGGLLTVPAMLLTGIAPLQAIATNKFQGLFGTGAAALTFARGGHVNLRREWPIALMCFSAAVIGAAVASYIPTDILRIILPIVLIAIAIYFVFQPRLTHAQNSAKLPAYAVSFVALPLVGFYDGVFGPGAGSFYMLVLVALGGLEVLRATARTKVMNFASNFGGFLGFAFLGVIAWKIGLVMAIGQIIGATLGARLAITNGAKVIRPILVIVCVAMALRLLFAQ